ncbi:MAG: hypothetical protein QXU11_10725 [Thermoproteota archaeon]
MYTRNRRYSEDGRVRMLTPPLPEIGEPHEYLIRMFVNSIVPEASRRFPATTAIGLRK